MRRRRVLSGVLSQHFFFYMMYRYGNTLNRRYDTRKLANELLYAGWAGRKLPSMRSSFYNSNKYPLSISFYPPAAADGRLKPLTEPHRV